MKIYSEVVFSKNYKHQLANSIKGLFLGASVGNILGTILGKKRVKRERAKAELLARIEGSKGVRNKLLNTLDKKRLDRLGQEARDTINSKKIIRKSALVGMGVGAGSGSLIGTGYEVLRDLISKKKAEGSTNVVSNLINQSKSDIIEKYKTLQDPFDTIMINNLLKLQKEYKSSNDNAQKQEIIRRVTNLEKILDSALKRDK